MPVKYTAKALKYVLWLSLLAIPSIGPSLAETQKTAIHLKPAQARQVAHAALNQGRPQLAFSLSEGLIEADPKDGHAYYLQALALGGLKDFKTGRKRAARAYRLADTPLKRYESAKLAAELSFAGDSFTTSQIWLRRAVQNAPDEATRDSTVLAFKNVRSRNPISFHLNFSVRPSDNVNNGSNSPFNIIDGSPINGFNSESAQAIDGIVASLDLRGSYRLIQTETRETRLTGRVLARHVEFTESVEGISSDDLASHRVEFGVDHVWAASEAGYWRAEAKIGRTWFGFDPLFNFANIGLSRQQNLTENLRLTLGAEFEEQFSQSREDTFDANVWSLSGGLTYNLPWGDTVSAHVQYRDLNGTLINRTSTQWSGLLHYQLSRPIGPAKLSVAAGHSSVDYDQFFVAPIFLPDGRQDNSWFGSVSAKFEEWSYLGFVPTVSVRTEQSRSNISRFDVDQTGVSFGISSEF